MYTSDTLEAHAPGSITTFRSSNTETETQPHGCLGMTAHLAEPKTMLHDFTGFGFKTVPCSRVTDVVHSPIDLCTHATHTIHRLHLV